MSGWRALWVAFSLTSANFIYSCALRPYLWDGPPSPGDALEHSWFQAVAVWICWRADRTWEWVDRIVAKVFGEDRKAQR